MYDNRVYSGPMPRKKKIQTRKKFESVEAQTERLQLRLPQTLAKALRAEAQEQGVSRAWVIKESLYKTLRLE